ncbi:MAG: hypothetical protein [Bacteriophage sp.]|nr:MAG: hypothetical protein [Bacteriophage sp.]
MRRHFKKNKEWVLCAIEEIIVGLVILMNGHHLNEHVPPILQWTDNTISGLIYLILGVVLLINALWDFYWYRIRITLIGVSAGMWAALAASYLLNSYYTGVISFMPFLLVVIFTRVLIAAYQEPVHKLKGGASY